MTVVIHFAGGEDSEFSYSGNVSIDTTSAHRRTTYSRCALKAEDGNSFWGVDNVMSVADVWVHARVWMEAASPNLFGSTLLKDAPIKIVDANGIIRLIIYMPSLVNGSRDNATPSNWGFAKVSAAGTVTQIGSIFSAIFAGSPSEPDEIDIHITNYATGGSGTVEIFINKSLAFSTSSATLATDGNTTINGVRFSAIGPSAIDPAFYMSYSEVIISDSDTRNLTLATLAPDASGNTDNWTTGSVSDINEVTLDDTTTNTSDSTGEIQQYTITGIPSGSFGVVALVFSARAQSGSAGGPGKLDFGVRTGGSDYWGSDITLETTLERTQDVFYVNPATSVAFTMSELGNVGFNIGMKSVT